jgi:putative ABC transport system permease protein
MLADLRFSIRALLKNPGFTLIAVLTIALGIGANSAMFSVVYCVLLKPLPYRDASRLVRFQEGRPDLPQNISYANFMDWRERNRVFDDMVIYNTAYSATLSGKDGAEVLPAATTEPKLFDFLGLPPALGRTFAEGEDNVVVISDRLWKSRYGADPAILGQSITINRTSTTVVGVLPPAMRLHNLDIWIPLLRSNLSTMQLNRANHPGFQAMGRLKRDVTMDQARLAMTGIAKDLEKQYPSTNFRMGIMIRSVLDVTVGGVRQLLFTLFGAVSFVLLIACANVANLMLSRALGRGSEIAVRAALGAGRGRLLRLFIAEGVVLALAGGALGIALGGWAIDGLKIVGARAIPRVAEIHLDPPVLAYTIGITLLTALLFSLAPALQASRANLLDALKQGGRSGSAGGRQAFRWTLIAAEVALSVVLLTGAGLMVRTLSKLASLDPGFRPEHILALNLHQPGGRLPNQKTFNSFNEMLSAKVSQVPGVQSVARSWPFDLVSFSVTPRIRFADRPVAEGREPSINVSLVSPNYFSVMSIAQRAGRVFSERDRIGAPAAGVVNEAFVRRFYPRENPVGKRVTLSGWDVPGVIEIVGVVADTLHSGLTQPEIADLYLCDAQLSIAGATLLVRTAGDPMQLSQAIRGAVTAVDPEIATTKTVRLEDAMWDSVANRRFTRYQLIVFAALALILATAGIYGVVSYSVTQRTQEFGIRMALGAEQLDVIGLVIRKMAVPVALGLCLGLVSSIALTRYLGNQLYGVKAFDPLTLIGVALVLALAALAGGWGPAHRAGKLDPLAALRAE